MVASIHAAPSAKYYLEGERALYYLTGEAGIGVWHGEAAEAFGFRGEVTAELLQLAFDGRASEGASLVQRQDGKTRQEAWDVTLSAPKSVSVLWSVLGSEDRHKIEQLVMKAAQWTFDYADENALFTRRGKGGKIVEQAKGMYALCPHATSRAQDPQLHVHGLAFNMCLRADGTTGSIRSHDLYLHKMTLGALFRVELAYLIEKELGVCVKQDGWKFEVEGVPTKLCDEFSKRRQQIETIAAAEGWNSPKVMAELALVTRDAKEEVSPYKLFPHWHETAREYSFGEAQAKALFGRSRLHQRGLGERTEGKLTERGLREAVKTLASSEAYFPERDIMRHTAAYAQARGVSASQVIDAVKRGVSRFDYRVGLENSVYKHYSTRENVEWERELLKRAVDGKKAEQHVVAEATVEAAEARVEKQLSKKLKREATLTADQKKSLRFITIEPGDIKPIQGYAGTGKTELLSAAHIAWKDSGFRVIGTALGGKAAKGLETATGIRSYTVESLLTSVNPELREKKSKRERTKIIGSEIWRTVKASYYAEKRASYFRAHPLQAIASTAARAVSDLAEGKGKKFQPPKLDSQTVLVVDEAAMLGTRAMLELKRECDKVGAKMVIVGDRMQLPPIEAGGPFWSVAKEVKYESLTTIIRQEHQWMKDALFRVIENEPEMALELYAKNDSLRLEQTRKAAIDKLVSDYRKVKTKDLPKALALTTNNEEARDINARIQGRRKTSRELGIHSVKLANGERAHKHDRVLFTLNSYANGVRNGMLGTVVKVEPQLIGKGSITIRLDDAPKAGFFAAKSQLVKIDLAKYDQVQLGYAVTTHKAQGATVDRSFVLMGGAMLDKEMAFTQLSRAKKETKLYTTEHEAGEGLTELAKPIKRSRKKDLAHDHDLQRQAAIERDRSLAIGK